jgi:hypothetical protein
VKPLGLKVFKISETLFYGCFGRLEFRARSDEFFPFFILKFLVDASQNMRCKRLFGQYQVQSLVHILFCIPRKWLCAVGEAWA